MLVKNVYSWAPLSEILTQQGWDGALKVLLVKVACGSLWEARACDLVFTPEVGVPILFPDSARLSASG